VARDCYIQLSAASDFCSADTWTADAEMQTATDTVSDNKGCL